MADPTSKAGPAGGYRIRAATGADAPTVLRLLASAGLPVAGVEEALSGFLLASGDDGIVAVAGLEVHAPDGVLRSVAVAPEHRGGGLGSALTDAVVRTARERNLRALYLLTTTAEGWFPRFGFRPVAREAVAPAVRASVEFREACPASAVAMVLDLQRENAG